MLTAKKVERTKEPGRYRCGLVKGLLLQISDGGAKSWVLRFELNGRERIDGVGVGLGLQPKGGPRARPRCPAAPRRRHRSVGQGEGRSQGGSEGRSHQGVDVPASG